ncbi:MAG: dipeptidase [Deltaproteobacteria bacterium]|nr:dipeptidase [Deltaproteobacteria bacterium]
MDALGRREFLLGVAALGACAPRLARTIERPIDVAALPRWPGYADATVIDGAAGLGLTYAADMPPDEAAPFIANELAAARASGLTAVVTTVAPSGRFWLDDAAFERTKASIAAWKAAIAAHPDVLVHVATAADLDAARRDHRLGVVFTFQGTEPLGEDPDRAAMFHGLGVRVIQLTHNRRNLVGDGATEPGNAGLSNLGHEMITALEAAKIVVDLAHGSQRTIHEGLAATTRPPLISHTGCRALADLPRNTGDVELRMLAERGGVAGMIFWPYLRTDTQPMAIDLVHHLEHAIDVCGEDHVGLGSDGPVAPIERTAAYERDNRAWVADAVKDHVFEPGRPADLYTFIPDLNVAARYERIAALLAARGHGAARIGKILGGNFARVMREIWGA